MIIYRATNIDNGKSYVGQTVLSLKERKANHMKAIRANSTTYFHNALNIGNFEWEVVCEVANKTCLDNYEVFYIKEFGTLWPEGYNLTSGGGQFTFTDKVKQQMSESHKGVPLSEDHKKSISKSLIENTRTLGFKHSDETKTKMSAKKQGKDNPFYGQKHTEETRAKISAAGKNRKDSEETKRRKSESIKLWWKNKHNEKRK